MHGLLHPCSCPLQSCTTPPLWFQKGTLLDLLVVSTVDIHLLLDLALESVLQRLRVSMRQCFGWVVWFQQKTKLSVNVIPK
jgi:hypothetical protein